MGSKKESVVLRKTFLNCPGHQATVLLEESKATVPSWRWLATPHTGAPLVRPEKIHEMTRPGNTRVSLVPVPVPRYQYPLLSLARNYLAWRAGNWYGNSLMRYAGI